MALAEYDDLFWFPSGELARNIEARVFLLESNTLAPLFADADGDTELPNPRATDNDGRLKFWAEIGFYWIHIDSESFRVGVGVSEEDVTPDDVAAAIATHNADTTAVHGIANTALLETQAGAQTKAAAASLEAQAASAAQLSSHSVDTQNVHGISDTSNLETQSGAQDKADAARDQAIAAAEEGAGDAVEAHRLDTTNVHGITNTALLETQAGAQTKANTARDAAVATAAADATAKANAAEAAAASALADHAANGFDVHGIADTSVLETQSGAQTKADAAQAAAQAAAAAALAGHAADTTAVHGIADTSLLASSAEIDAVAADLAAHAADTTNVHGIADTALLETQAGAQAKADQARDEAIAASGEGGGQALLDHIADTTSVHGIANTANLETVSGAQAKADAAEDSATAAAQAALDLHAADTTNVHGIADTAALETVTGAQAKVDTHSADTTAVHGIANTANLETVTGAQAKADQAAADAVDAHALETQDVHGISDTSELETASGAQDKADAAVAAHSADTTAVHGIANTALLETVSGAQAKADAAESDAIAAAATALAAHAADTTAIHGITDTAALETQAGAQAKADAARDEAIAEMGDGGPALAAHIADTLDVHGISDTSNLETQSGAADKVSLHSADTTAVHGIANTALLETISGAQAKADAARDAAIAEAAIAPTRKTPAWRRPSTSFQFQTGHGWTASGAASSNLNNTTAPVRGKQYASITTDTAAGSANLRRYGMAPIDLTGKAVRIICRISDVSKVANINFFAGVSSLATYFRWRLWQVAGTSQLGSSNEWITLTFGWADVNAAAGSYSLTAQGLPSTTTGFTDLQVQAIATSGQSFTLDVQAVEFIEAANATFPSGVVSVVFDDGAASIWDLARPAMDDYGFPGTNYVIVQSLGTSGVMTAAQNLTLQNLSGWEVGLHSFSTAMHDARYTTYTAAQVDADIRAGRSWLVRNGFAGESVAYPGGEYQKTTDGVGIDAIASRYFSTGRTILHQTGFPTESYPAGMPMRMRAVSSISSLQSGANNPANLVASGGLLDRCQLAGGWLVLVFHKITAGAATVSTECSETDFRLIMAGINARGIPVVPVSDVMHLYS
ncbi:polysaccharide deacetylase family protein [Streptomyces sp. NPDC051907]|uniref:polysaccharide deacetylase family protein n=1 Tax=Streptomyces sp. NPDC051907 TaxID=3155284 RepID=UPI00343620D0